MIKGYNQKFNKKNHKQNNHFKVGFVLPDDISENVKAEVMEVLESTKFNKISFPISTYRYYVDSNVDTDDNRVVTVGYIKNYDVEKQLFTIVIFGNNRVPINEFDNPTLEIVFSEYNGKLGTITKINIINLEEDDDEDESDETVDEE